MLFAVGLPRFSIDYMQRESEQQQHHRSGAASVKRAKALDSFLMSPWYSDDEQDTKASDSEKESEDEADEDVTTTALRSGAGRTRAKRNSGDDEEWSSNSSKGKTKAKPKTNAAAATTKTPSPGLRSSARLRSTPSAACSRSPATPTLTTRREYVTRRTKPHSYVSSEGSSCASVGLACSMLTAMDLLVATTVPLLQKQA